MSFSYESIDFQSTGYFTSLVTDFLEDKASIRPFYTYSSSQPDFGEAILARQKMPVNRQLLADALSRQYAGLNLEPKLQENLSFLRQDNTFTVCTAHQPNIFTGYLYFIYKVLHTIRLTEHLSAQYPDFHFVPVYYMGSEDNDLDELGKINWEGKLLKWDTRQTGAVGRMKTTGLEALISTIEYSLGVSEHAAYIVEILKKAYLLHENIQSATAWLVNALFGKYGLVVLIADNPDLKRLFLPVLRDELFQQTSFKIVSETIKRIQDHYPVQAHPREINLFYLKDDLRERIVYDKDEWKVLNTDIRFTRKMLEKELETHPERFSPNVILRGMYQETILPNITFIGGGGELAYWMELKDLFGHYQVPYPVVMLRNSFLWVDKAAAARLKKLEMDPVELFGDTERVVNNFVLRHTNAHLALKQEYETVEELYRRLESKASQVDHTLVASVGAEKVRALRSVGKIEHKFLRAEKKKFSWQTAQIRDIRAKLFPGNSLQERSDNFLPYYVQYGEKFFDVLLAHTEPVTARFQIIIETPRP